MSHKVEINIDDDILWDAMGRFSSVSGRPVSEIIRAVWDVVGLKYTKIVMVDTMKSNISDLDFPEIDIFLKRENKNEN